MKKLVLHPPLIAQVVTHLNVCPVLQKCCHDLQILIPRKWGFCYHPSQAMDENSSSCTTLGKISRDYEKWNLGDLECLFQEPWYEVFFYKDSSTIRFSL